MIWLILTVIVLTLVLHQLARKPLPPGQTPPLVPRGRRPGALRNGERKPRIGSPREEGTSETKAVRPPTLKSLQEDFAAGRITMTEYERRVGELYGIDPG